MNVTIVSGQEDWQGLYIDGKLVDEGHSLDLWRVLTILKAAGWGITDLNRFTLNDAAELALGVHGRMPQTLAEVREWEGQTA